MAFDKPYTPQSDSLASTLCGFFTNNPDVLLTLDDITDRFMARRANVHTLLARAVETKLLTRSLNSDGEWVYRRGPSLPPLNATAAAPDFGGVNIDRAHTPQAPKATSKRAPKTDLIQTQSGATLPPLPTVEEVVIEDGIPLPERGTGRTDWTPLLAKLKPGQSAQLPIRAKATLSKCVTGAHAAKTGTFKTRCYPDTATVRVWRVA